MTAQMPDRLENKHPRMKTDLDGLYLYGVTRGDVRTSPNGWGDTNAFVAKPIRPANASICSALWRGYIAKFLLQEDGRLRLVDFEHLIGLKEWFRQPVDELLEGDFWMVLKPEFFALRTYIPFKDGLLIEDREEWFTENR
jgi:hypothetical protein